MKIKIEVTRADILKMLCDAHEIPIEKAELVITDAASTTHPMFISFGGMNFPRTPASTVREYLRANNLIGAIREVRAMTGAGLKDAKDYVEWLRDTKSY